MARFLPFETEKSKIIRFKIYFTSVDYSDNMEEAYRNIRQILKIYAKRRWPLLHKATYVKWNYPNGCCAQFTFGSIIEFDVDNGSHFENFDPENPPDMILERYKEKQVEDWCYKMDCLENELYRLYHERRLNRPTVDVHSRANERYSYVQSWFNITINAIKADSIALCYMQKGGLCYIEHASTQQIFEKKLKRLDRILRDYETKMRGNKRYYAFIANAN